MSILKTTFVTTALILGSVSSAMAQDAMVDKAKDMAVDKGVDMAKDKAMNAVGDSGSKYADPAAKVSKKMLKGDSAKDAVLGAATSEVKSEGISLSQGAPAGVTLGDSGGLTSTSLSTDEAVTAGKVMIKGGSKEDAAMAVAKDRVKDQIKSYGSDTAYGSSSAGTSTSTAPVVAAPSAPAAAVNCPSGTTAQPNGTCMITGNYK